MHSHDFRDANELKGKKVLVIGASYSGVDIALQCIKYGAESVICTWRSRPLGFNWPKEIWELPLVQKFFGKIAVLRDGTEADVDAVIMCTRYFHSYLFLRENLRYR